MPTYDETKQGYTNLINSMTINPSKKETFDAVARKIIAGKARYQSVSSTTGVPWQLIGVIHYMESDLDWNTHLANGDSLTHRTVHEPAGRIPGVDPPYTWEQGAVDALQIDGLNKVQDWPLSRCAYELEVYNGLGYFSKGINSPYLWSGTNHYTSGKFVSDGVFDPSAVSGQLGGVPLLTRVMALDISPNQITASSRKLSMMSWWNAFTVLFGGYFSAEHLGYLPEAVRTYKTLGLTPNELLGVLFVGGTFIVISVAMYIAHSDYSRGTYTPSQPVENPVVGDVKVG